VRDYLPVAAARRRGVVAALTGEFERWGYRAVITPLYEYDQVLARGLGDGATRGMRFVEPSSGEILALRPDLTPQVARLVATRMHDEPGPLRLWYEGSVVRGATELFQVGVELIDAPQARGDLEAILLCEAALAAAGAGPLTLDLGHAGVARAALEGLRLDEPAEVALHAALQKKDAAAVEAQLARARVSPKRRRLIAALPSLYGGPDVLARARALVDTRAAAAAIDELEALLERLAALGQRSRLSLDLGEVRGFRYYSGTRFAAYAVGAGGALSSGGRYDQVAERYGRPARATGFAVDVDRLTEALRLRGVPAPSLAGGLLVAGEALAAVQLATRLRSAGVRAVLDLEEPTPSEAALRARAERAGLARVALADRRRVRWFDVAGRRRGAIAKDSSLDALIAAR
jgi:ATP phosphoribosyltransferase regulatory subunit